jgi:hypothetical protein
MAERFGTDIGGVLAAHATLEFLEQPGRHLAVPEIEGSFDALRQLREEKFRDEAYVISMCDEAIEVRSREWLAHTNFVERTGVGWDRIIYCRTFADKARIAGRLGLTHFVDDRLEVLGSFNNRERLYLFQPNEQERTRFSQHLYKVLEVQSWREIVADILEVSARNK